MLSDFLSSSYLQYKTDTNAVASWLATTAKKCGYPVDLLIATGGSQGAESKQPQQRPSGRLKGKARKLAKANAGANGRNNAAENTQPPKRQTYTISIKDFVSLADYIASYTKPPVQVPSHLSTAIDRAIALRRSHGAELAYQRPEASANSAADKHNFFIGVLEHVRDVLRPRMQPFTRKPSGASETDATEKLANRFGGLEVQEPSEAFLQAPDAPVAEKTAELEVDYEAEQLQDAEEAFFTFSLLIKDFNDFRNVIMTTWAGYKQGMFDLVSASLMTNTAFDLARRMEENVKAVLDKHGGSEQLLKLYFLGICLQEGESEAYREFPDDGMNFRVYNSTKNIYWPVYQLLGAFVRMVGDRNIPQYKPGYYGTYDPTSDRSTKSPREKFREDQQILMEILPEFCWNCKKVAPMPADDELIRGLRVTFNTHEIPLWLLFAVQAYLDIHHTLRDGVNRGLAELQKSTDSIKATIKRNMEFHASSKLRVETWPVENDMVLRQIINEIDWVASDPINKAREKCRQPRGETYKLLSWHPVSCGMWMYNFKMRFHEAGVTFANSWGSILYTYHLYNALEHEKLLKGRWQDMDLVRALHEEKIFAGGPPGTPEDYLKRFCLSMGYSATAFAKDKRKGPLQESKKGPKGLEELAPVCQMFKGRFCHNSGQADLTRQDLEKILEQSNWERELESTDGEEYTLSLVRDDKPDGKGKRKFIQLKAVDLLENLRNALQVEALELAFDYFMMHRFCWMLLRNIKAVCEDDLRAIYGVGCIEKESQLPFLVGYIFMAATSTDKAAGILAKKLPGVAVTSKLMVKAAAALNEMVASSAGGIVSTFLKSQGLMFEFEE